MQTTAKKPNEPGHSIFDLATRLVKLEVGVHALELEDFTETFTRNKLVPYKVVAAIPKMQKSKVGPGGCTTRLPHDSLGLLFLTELEPHGFIGPHYHTDCVELVHVLEGAVLEKHTGQRYVEGQTHRIPTGQVHHYVGMERGARLLVEIYRPSFAMLMRAIWRFWSHFWQRVFGIYVEP